MLITEDLYLRSTDLSGFVNWTYVVSLCTYFTSLYSIVHARNLYFCKGICLSVLDD